MQKPQILVVDDEPFGRSYLQRVLSGQGWEVEAAATGGEALELYQGRDFDLLLLDYRLSCCTGLELLEEMRAIRAEARVILFSAFLDEEVIAEAHEQGIHHLLSKPFRRQELIAAVGEALAEAEPASDRSRHFGMVGESEVMLDLYRKIPRVAETESTVLITGESGTGKELVARAIHCLSPRRRRPLGTINCGAIPEGLLESELFGHRRGSFTGAVADQPGRVEQAEGGTLFLDEIGDLNLSLQVKILRLLQEHEYHPVGAAVGKKANVRILAASNQNLEELVAAGRFREDLYYRLDVVRLQAPSLRERGADVLLLAQFFLHEMNRLHHSRLEGFTPAAAASLQSYPWPGNVRELENLIARLAILKGQGQIAPDDFPAALQSSALPVRLARTPPGQAPESINFREEVDRFEQQLLLQALLQSNWNKNKAAELLQLNRTTLVEKLKRKKIQRPLPASAQLCLPMIPLKSSSS